MTNADRFYAHHLRILMFIHCVYRQVFVSTCSYNHTINPSDVRKDPPKKNMANRRFLTGKVSCVAARFLLPANDKKPPCADGNNSATVCLLVLEIASYENRLT